MEIYEDILKILPEVDPEEDPLKYYKMPVVRKLYFNRIKTAIKCLENQRYKRILDVGYGSGIMFPYLKKFCDELYGIDKHGKGSIIKDIFDQFNIKLNLYDSDILKTEFENEFFDCITCISVLDHIKDYAKAIDEIYRILKPSGILLIGLVVKNFVTDFGFNILKAKTDIYHVATHEEIFREINKTFNETKFCKYPKNFPPNFSLYICKKYIKM